MSVSIFTNEFFQKHGKPDLSKTPNYGVVKLDIGRADLVSARVELSAGVGQETTANVYNKNLDDIRKVRMWRIPLNSKIAQLMHKYAIEINDIFNYKISAIQDIQYLEYKSGDYYKTHSDINTELGSTRKISISWVVDDDYEGGDLKINYGGEEVVMEKTTEQLIAFTSFMSHCVTPITSGTRKVLVCWISGESWR